MSNFLSLSNYRPQAADHFFFDTNVWFYIYYPMGDYEQNLAAEYSRLLKQIREVKAQIVITSLVLSEFYNRCLRNEFYQLRNQRQLASEMKFKEFRSTELCKTKAMETIEIIKNILKAAHPLDDHFSGLEQGQLFNQLEESDFNDKYHMVLAGNCGLKIVTHDRDFFTKDLPLTIISALNP